MFSEGDISPTPTRGLVGQDPVKKEEEKEQGSRWNKKVREVERLRTKHRTSYSYIALKCFSFVWFFTINLSLLADVG